MPWTQIFLDDSLGSPTLPRGRGRGRGRGGRGHRGNLVVGRKRKFERENGGENPGFKMEGVGCIIRSLDGFRLVRLTFLLRTFARFGHNVAE